MTDGDPSTPLVPEMTPAERGSRGEDLAAQALTAHGYSVIERNWRCAQGEIDMVAQERGEWVFVEVRLRRSRGQVSAEESVTPAKRRRLWLSAQAYLEARGIEGAGWRIDVVALEMAESGLVRRLNLYRDAVRDDR